MIIILNMNMNTEQKRVILDELRGVTSHPTADEVYVMAKSRLPRISLATVYRNLDRMADRGEILRLAVPGKKMRFDARTEAHCHLRCDECGCVVDLEGGDVSQVLGELEKLKGKAGIREYSLELRGLCPACGSLDG